MHKSELNTADKHNSVSETRAKCHNSAFCARDDEIVTDSDNAEGGTCEHDHSKDVCAESLLDNTFFSYAVADNTLSNASTINDDTQNEQVCFDDDSHVSRFSFVTWNVGGLLSKLNTPEFVSYVASFDSIRLCETFVETFRSSVFPEHTLLCCPALKLFTQRRRSGGVVVLIRTKFGHWYINLIVNMTICCCLLLTKSVLDCKRMFYSCGCMYHRLGVHTVV